MKIETDEYTLTYRDDQATKDKLFEFMLKFFNDHNCYHGESVHQSDSVIEDAYGLLTDVCENVFEFKQTWKE